MFPLLAEGKEGGCAWVPQTTRHQGMQLNGSCVLPFLHSRRTGGAFHQPNRWALAATHTDMSTESWLHALKEMWRKRNEWGFFKCLFFMCIWFLLLEPPRMTVYPPTQSAEASEFPPSLWQGSIQQMRLWFELWFPSPIISCCVLLFPGSRMCLHTLRCCHILAYRSIAPVCNSSAAWPNVPIVWNHAL